MESKSRTPEKVFVANTRDMDTLRGVTKDAYRELGELLSGGTTTFPTFGCPLVCYTPPHERPKLTSKVLPREPPNAKKGSLWKHLCRAIFANGKGGHQMLIRDLLDSYDDVQENLQEVLQKFARGTALAAAGPEKAATLRVSKRIVKPRGEGPAPKRRGHAHRH